MIRLMQRSDYDQIKQIHEKHYGTEFPFPDFSKFIGTFVVNDSDKIILAGGVRTIVESILITNKDFSPRERRAALYEALTASAWLTEHSGHNQLHAFVQGDDWYKQLLKVGFKDCIGKAVFLGV